jgi:2,4-dienoyl-CoA reductase-like NADH-dependent reductase (Old Yellow Enzyme family)
MDRQEIEQLIRDTAQTTAAAATARFDGLEERLRNLRADARRDLHASEGWLTWKQLTPAMRRRAGLFGGVLFMAGVALGLIVERMFF